jgi:hypothetical protein
VLFSFNFFFYSSVNNAIEVYRSTTSLPSFSDPGQIQAEPWAGVISQTWIYKSLSKYISAKMNKGRKEALGTFSNLTSTNLPESMLRGLAELTTLLILSQSQFTRRWSESSVSWPHKYHIRRLEI